MKVDKDNQPKRGEKYRLPKGATVYTTHPKGHRTNPRQRVVTAFDWRGSYADPDEIAVEWVGSGGYWCWCYEWEKA
jgi:hypothetical protein